MNKPRIIKDFEKLSEEIVTQIKLEYLYGFDKKLVNFKNKEGKFVSALPFENGRLLLSHPYDKKGGNRNYG